MHNYLESDDFGVIEMTEAINEFEIVPGRLGSLGLFRETNLTSLTVGIETRNKEFRVIPTAARGSMPNSKTYQPRNLKAIPIPHLPHNDSLPADDVQGVRAFGSESELESVAETVNQKLEALTMDHELTWEYHRIGAIQGQVKDADGSSVIVDLFSEFNVTRESVNWDQSDTTDGLKLACVALRRKMETNLKNVPYRSIHVMCGEEFWTDLITSAEVKDAYERWMDNDFARNQNNTPFTYAGIAFEELRGGIGSVPFIPDAEGASFPRTAAPLFKRFNAPANFLETVNTRAKRMYAKRKLLDYDTGYELHTQSNPLHICERPLCLIQFTKST